MCAAAEHVVIVGFYVVQDALVEPGGGGDRKTPVAVEPGDSGLRLGVQLAHPTDLEAHEGPPLVGVLPGGQVGFTQPEGSQLGLRQVNAPTRPVFGHVAQDVRQLERNAELDGVGQRFLALKPMMCIAISPTVEATP